VVRFEEYLCALPMLHTWDGGTTWNTGGFQREHLEVLHGFLKRELSSSPAILETGAGNSTIAMLFLAPGRLVSVAPERALFERIRTYCEGSSFSLPASETERSVV
jgi:hypothetical protein